MTFHKFQTFLQHYYVDAASNLSISWVDITVANGNEIKAETQCIFCRDLKKTKKVKVFCQMSEGSQCWIFSNLKRHMDSHLKSRDVAASIEEATQNDEIADSGEETSQNDENREYEDSIFTQLSVQNLKVQNATEKRSHRIQFKR